jgi:hypothetical protein
MGKIILKTPLGEGKTAITELEISVPNAGSLRGTSLSDIAEMKVNALLHIMPRITKPILTSEQAAGLSFADLMFVGAEIAKAMDGRQDGSQDGEAQGGAEGNDTQPA